MLRGQHALYTDIRANRTENGTSAVTGNVCPIPPRPIRLWPTPDPPFGAGRAGSWRLSRCVQIWPFCRVDEPARTIPDCVIIGQRGGCRVLRTAGWFICSAATVTRRRMGAAMDIGLGLLAQIPDAAGRCAHPARSAEPRARLRRGWCWLTSCYALTIRPWCQGWRPGARIAARCGGPPRLRTAQQDLLEVPLPRRASARVWERGRPGVMTGPRSWWPRSSAVGTVRISRSQRSVPHGSATSAPG
jgi:hypothetical protein